jgi:SAM-dependent methyltransferase
MPPTTVADHYTHGALLTAIRKGLESLGKAPETATINDLGAVDEFHIGGRQASGDFLVQLDLDTSAHVLDVGCGLGGGARFVASRFGSRVTGIDLTPEFVETGQVLCDWVGLGDRIDLRVGSALDLPFEDESFDAAYMMHVGMNIADKDRLFEEVGRVLKPGGHFGIYDVMRINDGDLAFPVPWAMSDETSAVATIDRYRSALETAGFTVSAERNRGDFALAFFAEMSAKAAAVGGPPPLGTHILMGERRAEKIENMVGNISAGIIAPVELIAAKADPLSMK